MSTPDWLPSGPLTAALKYQGCPRVPFPHMRTREAPPSRLTWRLQRCAARWIEVKGASEGADYVLSVPSRQAGQGQSYDVLFDPDAQLLGLVEAMPNGFITATVPRFLQQTEYSQVFLRCTYVYVRD